MEEHPRFWTVTYYVPNYLLMRDILFQTKNFCHDFYEKVLKGKSFFFFRFASEKGKVVGLEILYVLVRITKAGLNFLI